MPKKINVTVWNEFRKERNDPKVAKIYPEGIHKVIANFLGTNDSLSIKTAVLDDPEHGLSEEILDQTHVLIWWAHQVHNEVDDEIVERVKKRVLEGMGLIALHSAHYSKIFKSLMGTTCSLKWRNANDKERVWNLMPSHPIAAGIDDYFEIPQEEMYGEPFGIPNPDELIFVSWFTGGEVFRSGATWHRGHGRVFYFRPGDEVYPTYYDKNVQRVICNAVEWAKQTVNIPDSAPKSDPLEPLAPCQGS